MASAPSANTVPSPSALTTLLHSTSVAKTPQNNLAIQTLHNLQYQHSWTDLQLHVSRPSTASSPSTTPQRSLSPVREPLTISSNPNDLVPLPIPMISGRPPMPLYTHPDVQAHMIKHKIKDTDVPVEVEWVLPTAIGEKWTLRRFAEVFDSLPERDPLDWVKMEGREVYKDAKRIVIAMLSHAGMGGDGTIVYYIMQEGDVKPRQN